MKVTLKDKDASKDVELSASSWEELYDEIYLIAEGKNISSDHLPGENPCVAKISLEECECNWSVVLDGMELVSGINDDLATTMFASFALAEAMTKSEER